MKVALLGTLACEQRDRLRSKVTTPVELIPLPDDAPREEVARVLADVEIMVTLKYDATFPPVPRLRLLLVGGAGWDDIDPAALPPGVVMANAYGHEIAIAEYCLLAMLQWSSRFMEAERSFRVDGHWRLGGRHGAPFQEELAGKTVGILGYGHIGRALAPRARGMETEVIVSTRRPGPVPPEVSWMSGPAELDRFLERSDFVVVTCSLTPETEGLLDRRRIGLMKPSAVLINVARGAIIDEEALFGALRDRTIAGAVIDAWYRYPTREDLTIRPSRFPFHELPNVYMTPHSSAWTIGMIERRWATIAANLDGFIRGDHPVNVVHRT